MKLIIPMAFIALLLGGCPDSKMPTPPPKAPEPKLESKTSYSPPATQSCVTALCLIAVSSRA